MKFTDCWTLFLLWEPRKTTGFYFHCTLFNSNLFDSASAHLRKSDLENIVALNHSWFWLLQHSSLWTTIRKLKSPHNNWRAQPPPRSSSSHKQTIIYTQFLHDMNQSDHHRHDMTQLPSEIHDGRKSNKMRDLNIV